MPPILLSQPNIVISKAAWIRLATHRTKRITLINTIPNDNMGSHVPFTPNDCCNQLATIKESFIAAATPIIIAKKENKATTKPRLNPFITASTSRIQKMMSIII